MWSYSKLYQSRSAGHNRKLICLWWKPQLVLILQVKGGFDGWLRGEIQSSTVPFRLLVSSALVQEAPFWICEDDDYKSITDSKGARTSSAICLIFSSEPSSKWSESPGIIWSSCWKTLYSLHSMIHPVGYTAKTKRIIHCTYSWVRLSSGWSASSPIHTIPLFKSALTVHKVWTTHLKCWPWCTSRSVPRLYCSWTANKR